MDTVSQLYPEYYILKVNGFNQIAKSPLEEWIYYLNTGEIPSSATVLELEEARERLKLDSMTISIPNEKKEGRKGVKRLIGIMLVIWKKLGVAIDIISQATGLSKEEIEKL